MRRFLHENDLSLVMFGIFAVCLVGQAAAGLRVYNAEQAENGRALVDGLAHLRTGQFVGAVFENWESEFLQTGMYVLLTVFLFQAGWPAPRLRPGDRPLPRRQGGAHTRLWEHQPSGATRPLRPCPAPSSLVPLPQAPSRRLATLDGVIEPPGEADAGVRFRGAARR